MNTRPVARPRAAHRGRSLAAILLTITAILVAGCATTVTTAPGSAVAATVPPATTGAPASRADAIAA